MKNNIAAIVVTYNRSALLRECIDALKKSSIPVDIVIVNNASTDDTEEMIQSEIVSNAIVYFNTGKNIGGAGGFHYGIKKAYELGYEYFWLMDDDTIVNEDALEKMIDAGKMLNNNYGFLSSVALWVDGTECEMNHFGIADDWNFHKKFIREGIVPVRRASFVSFFVQRKTVEMVGYPIAEYFIWGDDNEYSQRITVQFKLSSYLVIDSTVVHKMKQNQGTSSYLDIEDKNRVDRMYFGFRNELCTLRRLDKILFIKQLIFLFIMFWVILFKKNKYKFRKLGVLFRASIVGIFFAPKIEYVNSKSKSICE